MTEESNLYLQKENWKKKSIIITIDRYGPSQALSVELEEDRIYKGMKLGYGWILTSWSAGIRYNIMVINHNALKRHKIMESENMREVSYSDHVSIHLSQRELSRPLLLSSKFKRHRWDCQLEYTTALHCGGPQTNYEGSRHLFLKEEMTFQAILYQ